MKKRPEKCLLDIVKKLLGLFVCLVNQLILAVLGLGYCMSIFSGCGNQRLFFIAVCRLLTAVASLIAEHKL